MLPEKTTQFFSQRLDHGIKFTKDKYKDGQRDQEQYTP
jgi:hypothetical protein